MSQERGPRAKSYSLAEIGLAPKTASERVAKLRDRLADKGAKRWELSPPPHRDDRPAIKAYAAKLSRKRAKLAKSDAG